VYASDLFCLHLFSLLQYALRSSISFLALSRLVGCHRDVAFDNTAIKYVGEAPARRVALPWSPAGQGRFPQEHRHSPVRATGKMVRGRSESDPDPQELMRDTDKDGSSDNDESVSTYSDRWVSGSGGPGFFWSRRGGPVGPLSLVVPF
jgi:hypothetical protein